MPSQAVGALWAVRNGRRAPGLETSCPEACLQAEGCSLSGSGRSADWPKRKNLAWTATTHWLSNANRGAKADAVAWRFGLCLFARHFRYKQAIVDGAEPGDRASADAGANAPRESINALPSMGGRLGPEVLPGRRDSPHHLPRASGVAPAIYGLREFATAGGLMSYASSFAGAAARTSLKNFSHQSQGLAHP
jgi:hypothetical protein